MTTIIRRQIRSLARFAARTVLPVLLLMVLALLLGAVRTVTLGVFGLVVALKVVMSVLELAGQYAPTPAYRLGVSP